MKREISMLWINALAASALVVVPVAAQTVKDPGWASALKAGQLAEVQRAASARIAAKPDDLDAHAALIRAVLGANDVAQRDAALKQVEASGKQFISIPKP